MSIGTAIFLSSLFLGLVGLYAATKDRWRWRLLIKRLSLTLGSVLVLLLLAATVFYVWQSIPIQISRQTEYSRIKVGASPDEVNYIKGTPTAVFGEMSKDPAWLGWQQIIQVDNIERERPLRTSPNGHGVRGRAGSTLPLIPKEPRLSRFNVSLQISLGGALPEKAFWTARVKAMS